MGEIGVRAHTNLCVCNRTKIGPSLWPKFRAPVVLLVVVVVVVVGEERY